MKRTRKTTEDGENRPSGDNPTPHTETNSSGDGSVEVVERLRAVTDAMPALISYIDSEYRYQFVNRAYTDWFGLDAENIIPKPLWEVLGQTAFENLKPHIDAALSGEAQVFETEIDYRLGGKRFIRASYTPDVRAGQVRGIFVLVVDISEERKSRDAVRRSEERYRAFIEHSTEGIWRFELEQPIDTSLPTDEQVRLSYKYGYLAECNDAMARQYGYTHASDIIGARLGDLLVESDPQNVGFLSAFIESGYHLAEAESHERDTEDNDRYFLNNFVGIVEDGKLVRAWGTQRDVTAARLADDATSRLASIVVSSDDAIISKDLNGIITSWNVGAERIFGYTGAEVLGRPISMLMPPERVAESQEILRRIRREESVKHFETLRLRKDGSEIFVSLSVSPIRNSDGVVIGASKIVRDITERKRIEETVFQNQLMLTLAMQSSKMGVWELDIATGVVSWSEELEAIFGLEQGAFGGTEQDFYELIHEDDRQECWNVIRGAIEGNREYTIEFRFLHADGSYRWMEGRGKAVYSQTGQPVRLYGIGMDITDRRVAEQALRESERRFSRFMQHLPGLAWIKDVDGKYIYANESAERSFGVSGDGLYGKTDEEIFPAETARQFRSHDRRAIESGTGIQIVESMVEPDGILHYSVVSKFPIAGADGNPGLIGGMAIDITDQKQAEEALRQRMDFDEAVMANMGEGLYTVDAHGFVTSINPAAAKLFGWTFQELAGRKMHEVTHYQRRDGSASPAEECAWLRVLRDGKPLVDHEDVFIRRDGTFFDVLYSSSPLRENDQIVGLVVVFTDITERKHAQARLALQAEVGDMLRTSDAPSELMHAVSVAVGKALRVKRALFNEIDLENDRETIHSDYCADGIVSVAGTHAVSEYSPVTSDVMRDGKTVVNLDSKTDPRTADHYYRSYERNGERSYVAVPLLRGGAWVASLWVSDDRPREWSTEDVAVLETIAERTWAAVEKMRVDLALRESQERFSKAFNSGPLIFSLSSLKDGRLVEVNETFVEVTGYSREEAIGKTSLELGLWRSEYDRESELLALEEAGQVRNLEYSFRTRAGVEIIGLLSAERIELGGEPFALTVVQDITDRKRAAEAVVESEAKYRTLFDSMDEGYCIIEVIFDDNDRPVDYLFIEVNSSFERQAGMHEVTGKRMLEFVTEIESHWLENYGRVARTGEPIRFANEYKALHRWFDVYAFRPTSAPDNYVAVLFTDITSRVRAEESLRESSEFNQDVIDSIAAHIAVLGNSGEITAVNEAWRQFAIDNGADWTMSNVGVGTNYLEVCRKASGDNAEEALAIYKGIRMVLNAETDYFSMEYPCHSSSTKRWFLLTVSPLTRTGGGAVVSHQNVTARRQAEQKIRESEARFRMMADNAPVMIWVSDPTGYCTFLSQSWSQYTGRATESGLGDGWRDAIHPDDRANVEQVFMEANEKCRPFTTEYRLSNSTGEYHWAIDSAQPRFDAAGNYLGYIGSVVDIHERKLAEQAIVKAERRAAEEYQLLLGRIVPLAATLGRARDLTTIYRAVRDFLLVSMPCTGFFVSFYDPETNLRRAGYVWGQGEEIDISELPPMELRPEGGGANSRAVFEKRTIITNNYWDEMKKKPHVIIRHDGRDPHSSLIVPMMLKDTVMGTLEVQAYENGAYAEEHAVALEMAANLAAVAIENVRLIETEGAMREAAEAANRAKDEFLSVLSHELRTPLNAMLGWVRMLKADVLDEENSARALEVIERNTRLQGSLIEDLLDVSRIISGKMRIETELVDLVSVVETVSETVRPLAETKGVSYSFESIDESVFLTADTMRLQQVVSNLLQNSIKFTPTGGEVTISIERNESEAILNVRDTGVGIEEELLPFIFDRFRQADASARRNFTGLGLGLTIVRNIVELHRGTIEVHSDGKNQGSLFVVKLPLSPDFYAAEIVHQDDLPLMGSLAGKVILLVDDDTENLTPIKIFLESEKAEVTPALTASEALQHLAERDFHIMITDIGMPEMDGYELVARLRSESNGRNAALKAIALTAYASVDDRERALQSGFQAHLAKPVNFDELLATIEKVSRN